MKFTWNTLFVSDMEKSVRFYRDILGLEVRNTFSAGGHDYTFLGSEGDFQVELICEPGNVLKSSGVSLGLQVESVEASLENMKRSGVTITSEPVSPNPHITFFFVEDPDGFSIQILENH